ncbi:MAG: RagB/SusD family nutrient uptake outer membrane protein, partial [Bacteroidales bacterium]|nr:RagB/SusD family nutrient uptake outer membrane protein [Bacteroidales bacterium]
GELPFLESGEINVTSGYDPSNPYAGRDPRLYASILYDGSMWMNRETQTWTGGMDSRTGPIAAWNGTMSGYYLKKFVPEDIPPMGSTLRATNPWIMFRYAEVLLNYAEANYELGKEDSARFYINLVRARPGISMPPVTATGEDLKKKIQQERRIELAFEGHRYFDVRRWKIADVTESKDINGVTITKLDDDSKTYAPVNLVTRKWYDKQYLLPIPQTEIDRSLGSLVQNPDYD